MENTFCVDLTLPLIPWAAAQGPARIVVYLKSPPDFSPGRLLKEVVRIDLSDPSEVHLNFHLNFPNFPNFKKWGTLDF